MTLINPGKSVPSSLPWLAYIVISVHTYNLKKVEWFYFFFVTEEPQIQMSQD